MTTPLATDPADDRELVISFLIDASRDRVWRCWTEPELLKLWFVPKPWTIASVEIDVRAGGTNNITMRDPDGNEYPNRGIYLEVVPEEKIVFTDAFTVGWQPSEKPYFVGVLTFEDEGGKTRYTARARHWNKEDAASHAEMGFHEGWGQCAAQLEEVAKGL